MYDVLIEGGLVVDGTGAPGYAASVAVSGDTVVAIGRVEGEARRTIDASGLTAGDVTLRTPAAGKWTEDPGEGRCPALPARR